MDLAREALFLFLIFAAHYGICLGAVYKVGDSSGWSTTGNIEYSTWASSKTFAIGDTLVFEYDPGLHNVMRVNREDFHECNATSPIATYSTGNDTFTISGHGHYYFVCGIPGHCEAGQKVDIRVPIVKAQTAESPKIIPARAPFGFPPEASPRGPLIAPSPAQNRALSLISASRMETLLLVFGLCVCRLLYY